MFSFDKNRLLDSQKLGQGDSGYVYPYTSQADPKGEESVVKIRSVDFEELKYVIQGIALGFDCKHQYILSINGFDLQKLQQSWLNQGQMIEYEVYLNMPRMVESLHDKITRKEVIPELQILNYFQEVVSGLDFLHKKQIAHRNIKPQNILLDKNGAVKIALHSGNIIDSMAGTSRYLAPELSRGDKLEKDELCYADLWSLGITILEICLSEGLEVTRPDLVENQEILSKKISSLKGKYSDSLIELIASLLKYDPNQRIKMEKLSQNLNDLLDQYLEEEEEEEEESNGGASEEEEKFEEEEESGEQMIMNSKSKGRRGPGEVREEEIEVKEGSILKVRDQLQKTYEKLPLTFEANETERALKITYKKSYYKEFKEDELKLLVKGITEEIKKQNYKRLNKLTFDLEGADNIKDAGVSDLALQIGSNLQDLTHLYLSFAGCRDITDSAFKALVIQIGANLKNLTHLDLNFSQGYGITDSGLTELAVQVGANLKNLSQIHLNFKWCREITDLGLKEFALHIGSNLKNLANLYLYFEGNTEVTDAGVTELAIQVGSNLKSLTHLHLEFKEHLLESKITDLAIKELALQIGSNLKNLTQLHLNFFGYDKITDSGIKELALQIGSNLTSVTHLHLNFSQCREITNSGLQELANIGPNLINLVDVRLNFLRCKVSFQGEYQLQKSFRRVKKLELKITG